MLLSNILKPRDHKEALAQLVASRERRTPNQDTAEEHTRAY
jgi:hypothetical protein